MGFSAPKQSPQSLSPKELISSSEIQRRRIGSAPNPVCAEWRRIHRKIQKQTHIKGHISPTAEWPARRHCSWQYWMTWHLRSRLSTMWFHSRTRCLSWVFQMCTAKQSATWQWHLSGVSQTLHILMSNFFYCRTAEDTTATHSVSKRDHVGLYPSVFPVLRSSGYLLSKCHLRQQGCGTQTHKSSLCFQQIVTTIA